MKRGLVAVVSLGVASMIGLVASSFVGGISIPTILPGTESSFAQQSIDAGPVKITLVNVVSSYTRTDITLEFDVADATHDRGALLIAEAINVTGTDALRPTSFGSRSTDGTVTSYVVMAGPLASGSTGITIAIDLLLLDGAEDSKVVEGPWIFDLDAGEIPRIEGGSSFVVSETRESNGLSVTVHKVARSSGELLVSYTTTASVEVSGYSPARPKMKLPDGTVVDGDWVGTPGGFGQDHAVSFSPPAGDLTTVELSFGPYLSLTDGGELEVELPSEDSGRAEGSYQVTTKSPGAERLSVDELVIKPSGFRIHLRPHAGNTSTVAADPNSIISVRDDVGNSYTVTNRATGFGKVDGSVIFREDIVNLEENLDPAALRLFVEVSGFAILESGPWSVQVDVSP